MVFEEITEEELEDLIEELRDAQSEARMAEERFHNAIVAVRDEGGLTFREIGEITEIAYSWVNKLYRRAKKDQARQDDPVLRRLSSDERP